MIYFQMRLKWRIMLETQMMTILEKVKKLVETNFLKNIDVSVVERKILNSEVGFLLYTKS